MRNHLFAAACLCLAGLPAAVSSDEWPQFRGPRGAGVTAEKGLPAEWGAEKNVQWQVQVPGTGWSQPIVWGDKVFVTTAITDNQKKPRTDGGMPGGPGGFPGGGPGGFPGGGPGGFPGGGPGRVPQPEFMPPFIQEMLRLTADQKQQLEKLKKEADARLDKILTEEQRKQLKQMRAAAPRGGFGGARPPDAVYRWEIYCLDRATGSVLWKQRALEGKPKIATQESNTYASETPVTDGKRVYAYFGMHGLYCYDLAGQFQWKKDLGAYQTQMGFGTASSPVLDGDRLFLQIDNEEKSFLVALSAATGDEIWRAPRVERTNWGSPIIWHNKERTELVAPGSGKVISYDPATGKVLWQLAIGGGQCTSSPVGDEDRLYVGTSGFGGMGGPGGGGSGGTLFAVRAGAAGEIAPGDGESASNGLAWSRPRAGPAMASPLVYQGFVYILERNGGMVSCYDARTGKPAYTRERIPRGRAFWASPWAYDGKVFCLDDGGTTHVLQAGPEFKVLGQNVLKDQFWSSPAMAGGSLILRGVDKVYCIKP
jgi:outer membrane protein assembly factor BamB